MYTTFKYNSSTKCPTKDLQIGYTGGNFLVLVLDVYMN